MSRHLHLAVAQMGPVARQETRKQVDDRLVTLLEQAHAKGAKLVVFPELALTSFFPRWYMEDRAEIDSFFETSMPNENMRLFSRARELGVGFYLGYAEKTLEEGKARYFNTSILVDEVGVLVAKYRKIHLPGHKEHEPWRPFQHLEKRYFETGNLGFGAWRAFDGIMGMALCNDRRWPETYRVLGLQGVEVMMLGYNTPVHYPPVPSHDHLQAFHNHLCMQAGAYQNGMWVAAAAKCGREEGCDLLGQSCIIAPTGEIAAQCTTLDDEVIVHVCDLDKTREIKEHIFNFALHREPEAYRLICQTKGTQNPKA